MGTMANLVSVPTLVESPFIIATIGGVTFGSYSAQGYGSAVKVQYPNYMESMEVVKVNGTVNSYTISFNYQVPPGGDPNLLDKIFSRAASDRYIILSYGDWCSPGYVYKEEKCIITNVICSLSMDNSAIKYTIKCTSDAIGLIASSYDFPAREAKPSDVLKEMLRSPKYGLRTVFGSMLKEADSLIASTDKPVKLRAQKGVTPLKYMDYLVQSMNSYETKGNSKLQSSLYCLTIHDDISNNYGGTYFKVTEVGVNTKTFDSIDTYELDVNYPGDHMVTQFSINNDQSWSILYEFSESIDTDEYAYSIDDNGSLVTEYIPKLIRSNNNKYSSGLSSWWTRMTQFPITATVTIKGLTRPSILMNYVRLNVWFAGGQKHISSGLYIITKQVDRIDSTGYKTTLTLLRVGGD